MLKLASFCTSKLGAIEDLKKLLIIGLCIFGFGHSNNRMKSLNPRQYSQFQCRRILHIHLSFPLLNNYLSNSIKHCSYPNQAWTFASI